MIKWAKQQYNLLFMVNNKITTANFGIKLINIVSIGGWMRFNSLPKKYLVEVIFWMHKCV